MSHNERTAYVLDDEAPIGALVCKLLAQCGLQGTAFENPDDFFASVKVRSPEIVILDLTLGRSDAIEVLRKLEALEFPGKIVLMSGRSMELLNDIDAIGRARGLAMLPPLKKPFRPSELKALLDMTPQSIMPKPAPKAPQRVAELEQAIANNWLELWYQPKVDLSTLEICGAEALIRVNHPELGIMSPGQFLPPSGDPLYRPLSEYVIATAMRDWKTLAAQDIRPKFAVNIPASIVLDPTFVGKIREHLPEDHSFPGLIVEITEDEIVQDVQAIREVAMQLKLSSVDLSIDDFGTAYASLARLRDLPCAEVKLDISFVANCGKDDSKRSICQMVLDLARKFNVKACAEGVESAEDLKTLITMGFDTAQGYIFAKPMPLSALSAVIMNQRLASLRNSMAVASAVIGAEEYQPAALAAYARRMASDRSMRAAAPPLNTFFKVS